MSRGWTLHLGDCLDILPSLPDASVDLIIADPPYGVSYSHGGQSAGGRSGVQVKWPSIEGDREIDPRWLGEAFRVLKPGRAIYVCCRWDVEPRWRAEIQRLGFLVKQRLTWHKRVGGKGDLRGTFAPTTEDVIFATKGRHLLSRRPPSLLDVGCVPTWERRYHPHQKPVDLSRLLIEVSTRPRDTVADFHMGSGTTGEACLLTGRNFIGVEINPEYFAIAERRLQALQAEQPLFAMAGDR